MSRTRLWMVIAGAGAALCAQSALAIGFTMFSVDMGGFDPITGGMPMVAPAGSSFFVFAGGGNTADANSHNLLAPFAGVTGAGVGIVGIQPERPTHVPFTNAADLGFPQPINGVGYAPQAATNTMTAMQLQGFWNSTVRVPSGPPVSPDGLAAVWMARIGLTAGTTIPIAEWEVRIGMSEDGVIDRVIRMNYAGRIPMIETSGIDPNPLNYNYRWRYVPAGGNAQWDVYDIMVEQFVPGSGTAAALAMAGIVALRRRR